MNNPAHQLKSLGQSLWLDSMTRDLIRSGKLSRYIRDYSLSGLSYNINLFEHSLIHDTIYDASILALNSAGLSSEDILYELIEEDITEAADLLRPIFDTTQGLDGWVSLAVSPLLANNTTALFQAAMKLARQIAKANLFVEIVATPEGLRASEELIYSGTPVNISLLFSSEHYLAAAESYMRGLERRIVAGLNPRVESVASLCVSPWDADIDLELASPFHQRLGIAMAMRTYHTHCTLLHSERWQRLAAAGARPQRILWHCTGSKTNAVNDSFYVQSLVAPDTINALPEATLIAFSGHGKIGELMPVDGGYSDVVLEEFKREGIDANELASCLQRKALEHAITSWHITLSTIGKKSQGEKAVALSP